jgi:NAD(P)-dependent dehydrogenase (short-subunit alcohol dehydrogenase family)
MTFENSVALVTGANRGLGRALVSAFLAAGAKRVYAAARKSSELSFGDPRVVPIELDVRDTGAVTALAKKLDDVTHLVNNAGSLASFATLGAELDAVRLDLETNFVGVLASSGAFAPVLEKNRGAIVNVLSVAALASMPAIGGYSASKAAALSLTQSLRGELRPKNVRVHAVFPGPIDTDMIRSFEMPKTSPEAVAEAIIEGLRAGEDDIFPDPMSAEIGKLWRADPKAVEAKFAAM